MTKNIFYQKMTAAKNDAYADGVCAGIQMGVDLVAIALNHVDSYGDIRLSRLEREVQDLINEIVDTNDPEVTREHIRIALEQIRGKGWQERAIKASAGVSGDA